ncbi:membrane protein of unknown function [Tenacibaculum sp. 190524A02b]
MHRFLYSLGTHASLLFVIVGFLILLPLIDKDNINYYKNTLKFSLLSPFISAMFFMTWVFIPGVNFNLLAYVFIGLCVSFIAVYLIFKLMEYIKYLKVNFLYKEKLLEKGIEYVDSKINS